MGLGNSLDAIVHHLLIGGMARLGYWDGFPMVSALVYGYILDMTYGEL